MNNILHYILEYPQYSALVFVRFACTLALNTCHMLPLIYVYCGRSLERMFVAKTCRKPYEAGTGFSYQLTALRQCRISGILRGSHVVHLPWVSGRQEPRSPLGTDRCPRVVPVLDSLVCLSCSPTTPLTCHRETLDAGIKK